ncbi:MAG: rod shape-determining protein MreC [Acidobacteria bacterium]|nr:rod shape-determining protein MreC [Acidobacteriota bacterium]
MNLLLVSVQLKDNTGVFYVERTVNAVSIPVVTASITLTRWVKKTYKTYVDNIHAQEENKKLREETFNLRTRLLLKRNLDYENRHLKDLLALKRKLERPGLAANVIGNASFSGMNLVLIDRGERDGIIKNMAVISEMGLVGRVWKAFSRQSQVQLISDPASGYAVRIEGAQPAGLLSGTGDIRIGSIRYFPNKATVKQGARVITTGGEGICPAGVEAGRILSAIPTDDFFQNIKVAFSAPLSNLEHVLVLRSNSSRPKTGEKGSGQ